MVPAVGRRGGGGLNPDAPVLQHGRAQGGGGDGGGTSVGNGLGARGLFGGSGDPADGRDDILFLTISTLGNTQVFGELSSQKYATAGLGSRVRGVFAGGSNPSTDAQDTIDFITIATLGNASDFGDLTTSINHTVGLSSPTRIVFAGGASSNVIQYREIMTTGDFIDFGNLTQSRGAGATASNGHGGLF